MTFFDKINEKFNLKINNFITQFFKKRKIKKLYLVEQYTTPFTPITWLDGTINSDQPSIWYYYQGEVTNSRDSRNFIYIHFMNFKGSLWRQDGTKAPWEGKENIYYITSKDFKKKITVCEQGILLIR